MYHTDDTIAAIATAPGGAARGIVRMSGPNVPDVLDDCFRADAGVELATLRRPAVIAGSVSLPDQQMRDLPVDLYYWPTTRSYTRQIVAELHTLGSPPLLSAVLARVCQAGARLAEPGEFTLRAFLAGRLDLAQAEAVLGVIDARGASQLQTALAQLAGGLTTPLHRLRESLVELLAHIEAGLDFVEEDIEFVSAAEIQRQLDDAAAIVAEASAQLNQRAHRDALPTVVLTGPPNVGKSSLFNALVGDGQALVVDQPGTTRDYLIATLRLGDVDCRLVDTAGLEHGPTPLPAERPDVERSAQDHSFRQAQAADACLLCIDATRPLGDWEREQLLANPAVPRLVILTKCDAPRRVTGRIGVPAIETSTVTGLGLDELRGALRAVLVEIGPADAVHSTADRAGDSLRAAGESLARATALNGPSGGEELVAAELRVALDELGRVVGAVYTDDILDRVFSRFCIGK